MREPPYSQPRAAVQRAPQQTAPTPKTVDTGRGRVAGTTR
jgi:hypothetical protein